MPTPRFDHSKCDHAHSGAEGKKARAKCRKEHAEKAAKKANAKPRAPRKTPAAAAKAASPKPAPRKVKETVPAMKEMEIGPDDDLTADL